jgi:Icc-related predicted phosphoesterase
MKLQIFSDLHREFGEGPTTPIHSEYADVFIAAGDIDKGTLGFKWLREFAEGIPVIYVCGNHEYYGEKFPNLVAELKNQNPKSNIHFLEDSFVEIDGWYFYGCTLWADFNLHNDWWADMGIAAYQMNDYVKITYNRGDKYRKLSAADTRSTHIRSRFLLEQFLEEHDPKRTIVVTHHAPSIFSVPPAEMEDPLRAAYASDLSAITAKYAIPLWIHGHIHASNDYKINNTRVISNPHGYVPDHLNPEFNRELLVDLTQYIPKEETKCPIISTEQKPQ